MDTEIITALETFSSTGALPFNPPMLGKLGVYGVLESKTPAKRAGEVAKLMREYNHLTPDHTLPTRWAPATMTTGRQVEIKFTQGVGLSQGKGYLHIRYAANLATVTPSGEVISTTPGYKHFRLDLQRWVLVERPSDRN